MDGVTCFPFSESFKVRKFSVMRERSNALACIFDLSPINRSIRAEDFPLPLILRTLGSYKGFMEKY